MALVAAAVFVARLSFAAAARRARPEAALATAPWDARALAIRAERLLAEGQDPRRRREVAALARRALRRDLGNASALTTTGFLAELEGDHPRAERLIGLSERLSRRDLRTQIWLIENAVARQDVAGALRHHDLALRTSSSARPTLFPVLAAAVAETPVRDAMAALLAKRPPWAQAFLLFAATSAPNPDAVANLFAQLRRSGPVPPPETVTELVVRLVAAKSYDRAWSLYTGRRGRVPRDRSRAPNFRQDPAAATPFDWRVAVEGALAAALPDAAATGLDVQAGPTVGGEAASQLQLLPPGRYRLEGRARGPARTVGTPPYWTLACVDGPEIARAPLASSDGEPRPFGAVATVPPGCPAQRLALVVVPVDAIEGVAATVEAVRVVPAREAGGR